MPKLPRVLIAASALALGACQYLPFGNDETAATGAAPASPVVAEAPALTAPAPAETPAALPTTCDVLASRGWEAWVDRMPGPGASPTMHIAGKVDVRSGGYTFTWIALPTDRSATPVFRAQLVAAAPTAPATQAITTEDVKFTGPALAGQYSRVTISCGTVTIGTVGAVRDTN